MNKKYIDLLNADAERIRKMPESLQKNEWIKHLALTEKYSPMDEKGNLKPGARLIPINPELGLFNIDYDPELQELDTEG